MNTLSRVPAGSAPAAQGCPPAGEQIDFREARYRRYFDGAHVSLWDQDFSGVLGFLDDLRRHGVSDLRAYFQAHSHDLTKATSLVRVTDVNEYTAELFQASGKDALLGAFDIIFLPDTERVFLDLLIALWEGKRRFETEATVLTLKGRRLNILLTVAWGGARCEQTLVSILDISKQKASEHRLATLNRIARRLSNDLDLERIVQEVTDSATKLSGAKYGAFFYNVADDKGERYLLYTLSGAPRSAFEDFGLPRNTPVFETTFSGSAIIRSDDIRRDPRYGRNPPHNGMPKGHLPVVSYLAVPVISRTGEVIGGLFFGHDEPGVFTEEAEEIVAGIAAHAALAIDNARLWRAAQAEVEQRRRAERSQQELVAIIASSEDAIISKDLNGIVVSWNGGAERLFGYSADEIVGKSITLLFPPENIHEEPNILDRIRRGIPVEPYETVRRRKDGRLIDVALSVSPVRDAEGKVVGASKIARDITGRKRTELSLARRAEEQAALYQFTNRLHRAESLHEVYDAALDAILRALRCGRASVLLSDDGVMKFVAWRGLSNAYRRAVEGHSPWAPETKDPQPVCIDDVAKADIPDPLRTTVMSERIGALAFIPIMANGRLAGKFMTYYEAPHQFTDADVDLALTIARQIGFSLERMRAQEELRKNEERERARATELHALMEAVPAVIWITRDPDGRVINGNRLSYEVLHLPAEVNASLSAAADERPNNFEVLVDGRVLRPEELPVQRAARGEEVRNFEEEIRYNDGTSRYLIGNATPLRDANGAPNGAVAAFVDITERRRIELALRESEQRLQFSLDAGRMGAWEWHIDTGQVVWSPGLQKIHGLEPGTFGGRIEDFRSDIHPEDVNFVLAKLEAAIAQGGDYNVAYRIILPNGSVRWLEAFGRLVSGKDGAPQKLAGVCMDVTDRKAAEASLVESERRFKTLAAQVPVGIFQADCEGRYLFVNRRWCELAGMPPEAALGLGWTAALHPADRDRVLEEWQQATRSGRNFASECRFRTAQGKVSWLEASAVSLTDAAGHHIGYIGSVVDITERKRANEQQAFLINELNHRVKNTLATVQAIAAQTLRGANVEPGVQRALEARLIALSSAHGILTQENWEGAEINRIIVQALKPHADHRLLLIDGPQIRLLPRAAVALAMGVHELATNAAKYGALSHESGQVTVTWAVEPGEPPIFRLEWKETGGPAVQPPKRRGFGSRLIERNLAHDLDGQAKIDFQSTGIVCTITTRLQSVGTQVEPSRRNVP